MTENKHGLNLLKLWANISLLFLKQCHVFWSQHWKLINTNTKENSICLLSGLPSFPSLHWSYEHTYQLFTSDSKGRPPWGLTRKGYNFFSLSELYISAFPKTQFTILVWTRPEGWDQSSKCHSLEAEERLLCNPPQSQNVLSSKQ